MPELPTELVPVDERGGFYVVSEQWINADLPFPLLTERERLVRRGYTSHEGVVHLNGRSQRAEILAPSERDDQFFAKLHEHVVTDLDAGIISDVTIDESDRYWLLVHELYGRTEGILPEQKSEILTSFVEPRLALAHGEEEHVAWGNLREASYLLISGAPGSGKTTLLRQWLLWHADRRRRGDAELFPLCLPLRDYNPEASVESALVRQAARSGSGWLARDFKALATHGLLAIGFDGLDEVPVEDRSAALERLSEFTSTYSKCRYLVTTRPGVHAHFKIGLEQANLLPFDRSRMRQLAYYKLHSAGSWKDFAARVESEPALSWVSGNPLALTLVIARYLRREVKPSFVGEIIEAVVEMFVDTWDSSRGIKRTRDQILSPAAKLRILALIADGRHLKKDVVLPIGDTPTDNSHNKVVLELLSEHTGLLRSSDAGIWSFRDATFQDYFNARMSVSALTSKVGEFRKLLTRPLGSAKSQLARFVGFLSSDIDAHIEEALDKLRFPELAIAVHLTGVVSQGLPLKQTTLDKYALFVASALKGPLQSSLDVRETATGDILHYTLGSVPGDILKFGDLGALLGALHRSRDGIAAEAVRAAIRSEDAPQFRAIEALLSADGELTVEQSDTSIVWRVTEFMPQLPSGPADRHLSSLPFSVH